MPGGFLLKGEDPEAAIRRELQEELEVELVELDLARVRTFPRTRQLEVLYRCRISGEPKIDTVELRRAAWFALDELPPVSRDQRRLIESIASR